MLLAVIDLAEAGGLVENAIFYRPALLERFTEYFEAVRKERQHPNAYMPFFHLRSDGFWTLHPLAEKAQALASMSTAVKHTDITQNVEYASLEDDLHELIQSNAARQELRAALITHWFGDQSESVWQLVRKHQQENQDEQALRTEPANNQSSVRDAEIPARTAAFRRIVLDAYDYRCAATGWRVLIPGGTTLIEAAHIVPFSESFDDNPRNGMALTPTFHEALDRNLIAPGPDMKWHVSPLFDKRIPDFRAFVELEGQQVIYEGDPEFAPSPRNLEHRLEMLRRV